MCPQTIELMKKHKHVSMTSTCQRSPIPLLQILLEVAATHGFDPDEVLARCGAGCRFSDVVERRAQLSVEVFAKVNRYCNAALRHHMASTAGEISMTEDQFALLCNCVVNSATLRQAIDVTGRFFNMFDGRIGRIDLQTSKAVAELHINPLRTAPSEAGYVIDVYGLAVMHMFYGWLIDQPIKLERVQLAYPRPKSSTLFLALFDCEVQFGGNTNCLTFAADYLRRPAVRTYGELQELLHGFPFDLMFGARQGKSLAEQVYTIMMNRYSGSQTLLTVEEVAATFHLTSSTLRRRLAEEDTTYSKIRKRCQLNLAKDFLRRSDMTVDRIAQLSSFSDPTAFRRAFRHWTGKFPSAYRHEILDLHRLQSA